MKLYTLILILLQFGNVVVAQNFEDKINQTIKNYVSEFPEQTQFSVAVVSGNQIDYFGQIKLTDTINEIDNSASVFQIGSVTKVFTSSLLAQLVVDKKLKLTDSLQKFFGPKLNDQTITLEKLSNHTSGLPRLPSNLNLLAADFKNPYKMYAEEDLLYYLTTEMKISEGAQSRYQYSNLGAAILTKALENATEKSFSELLSEYIFDPLKMEQSSLLKESSNFQLVQGLDAGGSSTPPWDMNQFEGAGEILSTTSDLSRFVIAHFNEGKAAFALTTMPTFMVNSNLRIGLGWHILKAEDGNDLYWHNGGTAGYSSSVFMIPDTQKAVILLTNVSAYHPKASSVDELGFKLLGLF
ncbi:serine hydrolase domain-containing protein [Psychroflexus tropicus]|uniref:serine hydrolase domain-containing protein n=1 Tax=Psychroflexus tropicus TaxID=197345 RepID=UPI00036A273B|nr:serine hydrolase domain-containing protein [Psychroflexus tropicus]